MGSGPRIAIDAMGGDVGPALMLAGAALAYERRDDLSFLLMGDEAAIRAELSRHGALAGVSEIVHCDDVITPDDKPRVLPVGWSSPVGNGLSMLVIGTLVFCTIVVVCE